MSAYYSKVEKTEKGNKIEAVKNALKDLHGLTSNEDVINDLSVSLVNNKEQQNKLKSVIDILNS